MTNEVRGYNIEIIVTLSKSLVCARVIGVERATVFTVLAAGSEGAGLVVEKGNCQG